MRQLQRVHLARCPATDAAAALTAACILSKSENRLSTHLRARKKEKEPALCLAQVVGPIEQITHQCCLPKSTNTSYTVYDPAEMALPIRTWTVPSRMRSCSGACASPATTCD